jgi:polyisoprenyl-teichoic acid--peptidoglycan teichoic acid transferase
VRPEDEKPDVPDADEPTADDQAGEHEVPPATWAGRKRAEGEGDGDEQPKTDGDEQPKAEDEPGLTEEFAQIERELDEELETAESEADDEAEAEELTLEDEADAEGDEDKGDEEGDEKEPEEADEPSDSGATVEAETLKEGDRTEAQEAAMAALKARAAKHEAAWDTGAQKAEESEEEEEEEGEGEAEEPESAEQPTVVAAKADEDEGKPRAKPLWARFLAASVLIIVSMAAATSISLLVYLTDIANGLSDNHQYDSLRDQLSGVNGGDPQTILILGSDKRLGEATKGDPGRSDTTILLRVNPDTDQINLLSIPRDLEVNIPNHGIGKFNEAYSYGNADLTLRVVENLTGLDINHLVNINFTGFADAVDAIDCVYVDVDHHYFNDNSTALSAADRYAEINIEAGYQRLCGLKALQYVRYRHTDNDLVRSARQQDFLREARQKVPPDTLIRDRNDLLKIFTDYTTSDISDPVTVLELMKTLIAARNAELREIHFPANLGDGTSGFVTASDSAIQKAVQEFLGNEPAPEPSPPTDDSDDGGGGNGKRDHKKPEEEASSGPSMLDTPEPGQLAQKLSKTERKDGDPMLEFPVYYPTRLVPTTTVNWADSRAFVIDGPDNDVYHGYKMVFDRPGGSVPTEYYGVSGTDWQDPPILANPSESREINGRDYLLYYDGDRLRMVAWKTNKAAYWVTNTLSQTLGEPEMISIATSLNELGK